MENENIPETLDNYYILNDDGSRSVAYTLDELAMLKTNEVITKDTLVIKDNKEPKPAGAFLNFDNDDTINTSGTGKSARLPKELNTYNVGAGILSVFWGYNHFPKYKVYWGIFIIIFYLNPLLSMYIAMLDLSMYEYMNTDFALYFSTTINLLMIIIWPIMTIIFLIKGNEIAWRNRKFKDIKQFKDIQRKWNIWGYTIFILFFMFIAYILFYMYLMEL